MGILSLLGTPNGKSKSKSPSKKKVKKMADTIMNLEISKPFGFEHHIHVDHSSDTGFVGLPKEWESALKIGGIKKDEVLKNPDDALAALQYCMEGHDKVCLFHFDSFF